jgi:uncharacterized membrane protein
MARRFWPGFAAGAAAGVGAGAAAFMLMNGILGVRKLRIVRLEKSLQVGRPVHEVFDAWTRMEQLPRISDSILDIRHQGDRTHWSIRLDGRTVEWDALVEQFIPNQAIGWKSVHGPKHTGRITFSPIGNDTLVQVTMNYAPPSPALKPFVKNIGGLLDRFLQQVLRDFKAALEGKGQEGRKPPVRSSAPLGPGAQMTQSDLSRATGTFGGSNSPAPPTGTVDRFGNRTNPVESSSPPDAKR